METRPTVRRYDIDWLRVFATYLLLFFHSAMVFNPAPFFHVRNDDVSFVMLIVCGFIALWHMPLFFLLAGWSAFSSVAARGSRAFLRERFFRLFVPLIAGCVLLMPPIKYTERLSGLDANYRGLFVAADLQESFAQVIPSGLPLAAPFDETFSSFLPTFFTDLSRFTWAHLWFVAYLLIFTVLYLPLFGYLRRKRDGFTGEVRRAWVYAPLVPLMIIQLTMRERWPGLPNLLQDWANFAYYSTYLIAGFCLARSPMLEKAAHLERKRALAIAAGATLVLLLGTLGAFASPTILLTHVAIAGWCYVVAFLGFAHQRLSFSTPRLRYLTESAFPVYLLHQSSIVLSGYPLIQLPIGLWAKFVLLLVVSTVLTLLLYHFAVRPFSVPRFLCGMKGPGPHGSLRLAAQLTTAGLAIFALAIFGSAAPSDASCATSHSPLGRWYAEGGAAQVEVEDCGTELCGRIVWLRSPFDENGCALRDRYNPDESLRSRPVLGLNIVSGLKRAGEGAAVWKNGSIYDPGSGNRYRAVLTVAGANRLELRGYVGIPLIGRTTRWFRVGAEEETCLEGS